MARATKHGPFLLLAAPSIASMLACQQPATRLDRPDASRYLAQHCTGVSTTMMRTMMATLTLSVSMMVMMVGTKRGRAGSSYIVRLSVCT